MLLPGYILNEEISSGPGWRMFRAVRNRDAARTLVKISSNDRDDQDSSSLLLGEHAILQQCDGVYELSVTEVIHFSGQVALIHEDFAGTPLSHTLASGPMPVHELLQLSVELCGIMMAVHGNGLVHGLLHPASILIERRLMRVKATNFFLTQLPGFPTVLPTAMRSDPGVVPYISPEQSGRIERVVDQRSDLYSAGALLYHALTGWAPFRSTDPMEVIYAHLAREAVPPHQVDTQIPETLSDIVMTLLAKDPSDRYQSAGLLRDDIKRCLDDIAAHGQIGVFSLKTGTDDGHFELSQGLVGREAELLRLSDAYQKSAAGRVSALIIDGYAGVGKSALVQSLLPVILRRDGSFIRGKADQMQADVPYAALSSAIRDFITQLLMENRDRLDYWRRRFDTYLRPVAGVVLRLIPEMEFFLSADHEVESVPQSEASNRFREGIRRLFDALSDKEHPLVFFLDDLQWVDNETLQLLRTIMEESRVRHLLFIGAVRGHEISGESAVSEFLNLLKTLDGYEGSILLEPLNLDQVNLLVSSALHCPPSQSIALSGIMFRKTRGNPFFLRQFLSVVHENGLLNFDEQTGRWHWETDRIEQLPYTENVVLLLSQRIQTWPEATRSTLSVASLLGNSFALSSIAVASAEDELPLEQTLRPAIDARLLLPMEKGQKPIFQLPGRNGGEHSYRFLHDRVQQAAYALIPEDQRAKAHLTIGRRLLNAIPDAVRDRYAFLLADQFNAGRTLLTTRDEKRELAQLNIQAGLKATESVAFASASSYFRIALGLLNDEWDEEFDLLWSATREIGRAEYSLGNHASASIHFETMSSRARVPLETAEALAERVHLMIHFGRYSEALEFGRQGLAALGHPIPERINRFHVLLELLRLRIATRGKTPEMISAQPAMTDAKARRALDLMTRLLTAAYFASAETIGFFILRMMRIVSAYGMIDSAAYVFSQYGLVLGAGLGRHKEALDFASTGVRMIEETPYPYWKTRVFLAMAAVVNHWSRDARENLAYLKRAAQAAQECGDLLYEMYPGQFTVLTRYFLGDPVNEIMIDIEASLEHTRRSELTSLSMRTFRQFFRDIRGETPVAGMWDTPDFHSEEVRVELEKSGDSASSAQFYILRMYALYLADRLDEADSLRSKVKRHFAGTMGQLSNVEYHLVHGLVACARLAQGAGDRSDHRIARQSLRKLRSFEKHCPDNFRSLRTLLEGELSGLRGNTLNAMKWYEQAIETSLIRGDVRTEAVASRCAARTCKRSGLTEASHAYARRAMDAFSTWGAVRYADACFEEFFREAASPAGRPSLPVPPGSPSAFSKTESSFFDLGSLLKATAVITSEIHLHNLVEKLLRIVVENAGAEHGVLFLEQDGDLRAIARWDPGQQRIVHLDNLDVDDTPDIPKRIIRYAERTQKQILLDSALASEQFGLDDDVVHRSVQSVLCMPILYTSTLIGVLYLENTLNSGVFHPGRIEFLQLLSSQVASALENARLYANLEDARRTLEQYSLDLEKKVLERTRDLQRRGEELQEALDDLQRTQSQLIQAEKMASLGELTAGIAHEIQNPLNFIRNFSEVSIELATDLIEEAALQPKDESMVNHLEDLTSLLDVSKKIHEHGLRIERIVRGMLDHSRSGDLVPSPASVNALVAEALSLSYHGMRAKDENFFAAVETSYDESIPELNLIVLDVTRVFINIISNSLFFLSRKHAQSGPAYNPTLSIWTEKKDHVAEIRIRDNGPGIARDALPKVFQPFYTTKPSGMGTGLGLSIGYTIIVEGHGGGMSVDSEEGEWTELTVRFPLP
jgi:histidine kinase